MENATEALIMAGSILLLIIALTVSISSFSGLRTQAQEILLERNKLQYTQDKEGTYLNYIKNGDDEVRKVGIETIIAAMTRMRKESYTIYIATYEDISDLNEDIMLDHDITVGDVTYNNVIKLTMDDVGNKYVEDSTIKGEIYKLLKDKTFDEYIGIYQWENLATEANKETYKIITFVQNRNI